MTKMICEKLLEKGSIDNYSIWTKHGEMGENVQGNDTEKVTNFSLSSVRN
jgi:hypothetical protein